MNPEPLELFYPVRPWFVFQGFGQCHSKVCDLYKSLGLKGHNGQDIIAKTGTIVRAAHDGLIVFSGEDATSGLTISIRTHDERQYGVGKAFYKTIYCHLLPGSIRVKAGQSVKVGDIIALSDNTGKSTGPHLHFGLKPVYKGEENWQMANAEQQNGYYGAIDPEPFFKGIYAEEYASFRQKLAAIQIAISKLPKPPSA